MIFKYSSAASRPVLLGFWWGGPPGPQPAPRPAFPGIFWEARSRPVGRLRPRGTAPPKTKWRLCGAVTLLLSACLSLHAQSTSERRRISAPVALYDDADPTTAGRVSVSEYISYGSVQAGHDLAGPSTSVSLGLHRRFDISADVGYVRSQFEQIRVNGIGDSYFGAKILLLPEGKKRPAVAVKPMIEVLGSPSIATNILAPERVNFVTSALVQKTFDAYRVYYMGGYITRGIWFQSLGWELNRWKRVTPVAIISHGRVTRETDLIADLGLNRSRSDFAGGATVALGPSWNAFVMAGRSFGREDLNTTRFQISGGIGFSFRLWGER